MGKVPYKAKRTYANGEKHVVYHIHTDCGSAYSMGWDTEGIAQFVRVDSLHSIMWECNRTNMALQQI